MNSNNKFWLFLAILVSFGLFSGCKTIGYHSADEYLEAYTDNAIKYSITEDLYYMYEAEYNWDLYLKARSNELNSNK